MVCCNGVVIFCIYLLVSLKIKTEHKTTMEDGIDDSEIVDVIKHIKKSSFYVFSYKIFLEGMNDRIAIIAIALGLMLLVFSNQIGIGTHAVIAILVTILLAIMMLLIVLYRYYVSYRDEPVNQQTYDLLMSHEPTRRYIYSGNFRDKSRTALTNIILYHSYMNLIDVKEKKKL